VAVGFVDVGLLAASCEQWLRADAVAAAAAAAAAAADGSGPPRLQPIKWVGWELSPHHVAKTLVLLTMMEQAAAVDEVLQVGRRG
jgi:hypothetical protein